MMRLFILSVIVACLISSPLAAQAAFCSAFTIRGFWGYTCTGYLAAGQGGPLTPTAIMGTCTSAPQGHSQEGHWTCEGTVSFGGGILTQALEGQATVNGNCTGTITYKQTLNGQPVSDLNIRYLILNGGNQIRGLPTDTGTVLQCELYRIGL